MSNLKKRLFEIIFYEEQKVDILYFLNKINNVRFYYIKHYKEDKKEHYHLLLYFSNARTISQVHKLFKDEYVESVKINMINIYNDKISGRIDYRVKYLVHYKSNDINRKEYDINEIITNDADYSRYFKDTSTSEEIEVGLILDFFDMLDDSPLSYRRLLSYIHTNGLWSTFRRNAFIFNKLLEEHNNNLKILDIFK